MVADKKIIGIYFTTLIQVFWTCFFLLQTIVHAKKVTCAEVYSGTSSGGGGAERRARILEFFPDLFQKI